MMHTTQTEIEAKINYSIVDDIIARFDFVKVHGTMLSAGWVWDNRGEISVPTPSEIKLTAIYLLNRAVSEFMKTGIPYGNIGTGGLMVTYFPWGMELSFRLEYSANY
jgi:hypothetical protein